MIVEELTVTKVMLFNPVPLPPAVPTEAPEMKIEPAPEVSKVIVDVVSRSTREVEGASSTKSGIDRDGETVDSRSGEGSGEVQLVVSVTITEVEGGTRVGCAATEVEGVVAVATNELGTGDLTSGQSQCCRCQHHQKRWRYQSRPDQW